MALLRTHGAVTSGWLQETLGVTAMTVWRDLRELEEQGLLSRVRGGAQARGGAPGEAGFEEKKVAAETIKQRIAERAVAQFVHSGDVVAMEGGTTVAAAISFLPAARVSIITNSLPLAARLREERPSLPVAMPGGWLSAVSGNLCGPDAVRRLAQMESAVCFIGATGFDPARGPVDPNPLEIEAKRAMMEKTRRVVLLLDGSKWERTAPCVTMHPKRIDTIVTDVAPPPKIAELLKVHGVRLMVASIGDPKH